MVVDSPSMMDAMATSPPSALYSPVRTKRLDDKGARLGALMDRGRKTEEWHPLWRPRACRGCRSPFGTAMAMRNEMETWRQPPAGMDLIRHPREGLTPLHRARRMSRMWHFSAPPWRRHGTSKTSSSIRPRRSATPPAPMPKVQQPQGDNDDATLLLLHSCGGYATRDGFQSALAGIAATVQREEQQRSRGGGDDGNDSEGGEQ